MRKFETGATRNSDSGKLDYEGFLSPMVLARFAQYMHQHRVQADGQLRSSDNWQKGIPQDAYMKSMWRHFMEVWALHRMDRGYGITHEQEADLQEALCAMMFNVMGYLFEEINMVGMHLPGQPETEEFLTSLLTLAPKPAEPEVPTWDRSDSGPSFPCHDPDMELDPNSDCYVPKGGSSG